MKKKNNNKLVRTTFVSIDKRIGNSESDAFDAWLDAGFECLRKCDGNASLYAKSAVWDATRKGTNTLTQTEQTIRQYVSAVVRMAKKHETRSALVKAYDAVYESREITAFVHGFAKTNKNGKSKKKKNNDSAVALTKRQARKAYDESKSFDEFWELING